MSDLVKRLRDWTNPNNYDPLSLLAEYSAERKEAADKIERLERELAKTQHERNHMVEAHAAEKALADRLGRFVLKLHGETTAAAAYRKARGL